MHASAWQHFDEMLEKDRRLKKSGRRVKMAMCTVAIMVLFLLISLFGTMGLVYVVVDGEVRDQHSACALPELPEVDSQASAATLPSHISTDFRRIWHVASEYQRHTHAALVRDSRLA